MKVGYYMQKSPVRHCLEFESPILQINLIATVHKLFDHLSYLLGMFDLCLGTNKLIFKEIHKFYTFKSKIKFPWGEILYYNE